MSFSNVDGNSDCSWYSQCDMSHLCEDCSKCGIGCPKYYPYQSEVISKGQQQGQGLGQGLGQGQGQGQGAKVGGSRSDTLKLLPGEERLTLRVFTDRTVVEAYFNDGRVAITSGVNAAMVQAGSPQIVAYATAAGALASAEAWRMGSIWVSKEQVLATPRLDGKK